MANVKICPGCSLVCAVSEKKCQRCGASLTPREELVKATAKAWGPPSQTKYAALKPAMQKIGVSKTFLEDVHKAAKALPAPVTMAGTITPSHLKKFVVEQSKLIGGRYQTKYAHDTGMLRRIYSWVEDKDGGPTESGAERYLQGRWQETEPTPAEQKKIEVFNEELIQEHRPSGRKEATWAVPEFGGAPPHIVTGTKPQEKFIPHPYSPAGRVTETDIDRSFELLLRVLGKRRATSHSDVGGWRLSYSPTYGGVNVEEIMNEAGGVRHPLLSTRLKPQEFINAVNFTVAAIQSMTA